MNPPPNEPLLPPPDDTARALVWRLLGQTGVATLAVLEAGSGHPLASRTSYACDDDGAPLILTSRLAAHTAALEHDARCSLLVGEPGAGDPLAHPRITLIGRALRLSRDSADGQRARARYLAALPKAALYADFPDFAFWRLEIERAHLNGGFGRAWVFTPDDWQAARAARA